MIRPTVAPRVLTALMVVLFFTLTPASVEGDSEAAELQVISSHSHDGGAFTQGLEMHDGSLYESTGLYGHSSLREVDPASGEVLRQTQLEESLFGEGITVRSEERRAGKECRSRWSPFPQKKYHHS